MKIGIIGPGNIGSGLGNLWAAKGHEVMFSYGRNPAKLQAVADAAGANARTGTPAEAAAFGEVVVLTVPWGAVEDALAQAGGALDGKLLWSTVNALLPDFSGLAVGTTTSAAETIAGIAKNARVVEALPVNAEILHSPTRQFGSDRPTVFVCGDDAGAKATVSGLLEETGVEPVDAGPLASARLTEPCGFLVAKLGMNLGLGPNVAIRLLRR